MKSLLIIAITLFSMASAHTLLRAEGDPCSDSSDCGRQVDRWICALGKCVQLEARHFEVDTEGSNPYGLEHIPLYIGPDPEESNEHRDFFPACPPRCPPGSKCQGGICVHKKSNWNRDSFGEFYFGPTCTLPCPLPTQRCVRGVCV